MDEGVFAFLDCLGWRGIWDRMENKDPKPLLSKLTKIQELVQREVSEKLGSFDYFNKIPAIPYVCFISDTITISLKYDSSEADCDADWKKGLLIALMSSIAVDVIELFINEYPPLCLRGCITYGQYLNQGSFIVGPAIDEAADYEKNAEGAFVFVPPSIIPLFDAYLDEWVARSISKNYISASNLENDEIKLAEITRTIFSSTFLDQNYDMPVKQNRILSCLMLNPLIKCKSEVDRQNLITRMTDSMSSDREDVILKRKNTLLMLKAANENMHRLLNMKEESGFDGNRV